MNSCIFCVAAILAYVSSEVIPTDSNEGKKQLCENSCNTFWIFRACEFNLSTNEYECNHQLWTIIGVACGIFVVILLCAVLYCLTCGDYGSSKIEQRNQTRQQQRRSEVDVIDSTGLPNGRIRKTVQTDQLTQSTTLLMPKSYDRIDIIVLPGQIIQHTQMSESSLPQSYDRVDLTILPDDGLPRKPDLLPIPRTPSTKPQSYDRFDFTVLPEDGRTHKPQRTSARLTPSPSPSPSPSPTPISYYRSYRKHPKRKIRSTKRRQPSPKPSKSPVHLRRQSSPMPSRSPDQLRQQPSPVQRKPSEASQQVSPPSQLQQPPSLNISTYNSNCANRRGHQTEPSNKVLSPHDMDSKIASVERKDLNLDTYRVNNAIGGFGKAVTSTTNREVERTPSQRDHEIAVAELNDMNLATVKVNNADEGFNRAVTDTDENAKDKNVEGNQPCVTFDF